ncbi:DUF5134 domain-containing protein [Streptomyces finlayi]|uniref:DUF5134 domain-containing protein n=1 Tax=Streptomyces finlayi TaxID=67296 RepID=A0A7G7BTP6_9ACTN|nr:DUF5134 domain-containing protein [Streptomyces finlayi]QNE78711.1 DUF5134 domain-containing protein [Streptomyces finlayi]
MHGPALSGWLLMVLCGVAGGYCLSRARRETGEERRAARAEAVMGFGMAAMAVPAVLFTPPAWAGAGYAALFGTAALRALWFLRSGGRHPQQHLHHLHHLVGSLAMVYMAVVMAPGADGGGHAGHGAAASAGGVPLLTGVLLVYYAFYVLVSAGRLIPVTAASGAAGVAGSGGARPELTPACRLTMGIAMFAMLLTL